MRMKVTTGELLVGKTPCTAVRVELPGAPLIVIASKQKPNCFVACGYVDVETADKLGDCAAIVSGVKTFQDVLDAPIKKLSKEAERLGALVGMRGSQFLEKLG